MSQLMLHCGAQNVSYDEVAEVVTPEPTKTWFPIPHAVLIEVVRTALAKYGYSILSEAHGLWRDGSRYFGLMQIGDREDMEHAPVLGLRGCHDRVFNPSIAAGSGVFVCDNLSFSGEIVVSRRQTKNIMRDLPGLIEGIIGRMADEQARIDHRFATYKETELPSLYLHDLLVRAVDGKILNKTDITNVLAEVREPRFPEFKKHYLGTAYTAFNAFTTIMGQRNMFDRPRATELLHQMVDEFCGLDFSDK